MRVGVCAGAVHTRARTIWSSGQPARFIHVSEVEQFDVEWNKIPPGRSLGSPAAAG